MITTAKSIRKNWFIKGHRLTRLPLWNLQEIVASHSSWAMTLSWGYESVMQFSRKVPSHHNLCGKVTFLLSRSKKWSLIRTTKAYRGEERLQITKTWGLKLKDGWSSIALAKECQFWCKTLVTIDTNCTSREPTLKSRSDWKKRAKIKASLNKSKASRKWPLRRVYALCTLPWKSLTRRKYITFTFRLARLSRFFSRKKSVFKLYIAI